MRILILCIGIASLLLATAADLPLEITVLLLIYALAAFAASHTPR